RARRRRVGAALRCRAGRTRDRAWRCAAVRPLTAWGGVMSRTIDSFATTSRTALLAAETLGVAPAAERLAALRAEPILLAIDAEHAARPSGQLMLATAASIVGRLFDFAPAIDVAA